MSEQLSQDTVQHLANLSRLALSPQEISRIQSDLGRILAAFDSLSKIDFPQDLASSPAHVGSALREDVVDNSIGSAVFLAQVPDREGAFVKVPTTLSPST